MTDPSACRAARSVIQAAIAGEDVDERELEGALTHIGGCLTCGPAFDLTPLLPSPERTDGESRVAEPGEPIAVFERALTAALSDPQVVVRARAAERLSAFEQLGPVALDALAKAVTDDDEQEVRETALAALDRLDAAVSLPQRLLESWSATPAEAVAYLSDVLARLADPAVWASPEVTAFTSASAGIDELAVVGRSGEMGRIAKEAGDLWLTLSGLPAFFDNTKPVLAVPQALGTVAPSITWPGREPGLAPAEQPVARGSLHLRIGHESAESGVPESLVGDLYLLSPRETARGI